MRVFCFSSRRRHTISTRDWSSDVCSSDLKWFEEIETISRANGYNHEYKQQLIGAYLKDSAATWYDANRLAIQSWSDDNDNSFKRRFIIITPGLNGKPVCIKIGRAHV